MAFINILMFKRKLICAPMNGVSDLRLGLACARAGILPSLIPYTYTVDEFKAAVTEIKQVSDELQVAYTFTDIVSNANLIIELGITHIEILEFAEADLTADNFKVIDNLRTQGVTVILKILKPTVIPLFLNHIDAVTIKGSEGAGRSAQGIDLLKEIPLLRKQYPTLNVIASGGVKNGNDIRNLVAAGACAISIGTLFAVSEESSIPHGVKVKLLNSTGSDIRRLRAGARQRAIVFSDTNDDDFNNTNGLTAGLATGDKGHVFIGNAIDSVSGILTVQEIVNQLLV